MACFAQENAVTVTSLTKKAAAPPAVAAPAAGHTKPVLLAHWAADGKTLLTVGEDRKVFRWDTATGKLLDRIIDLPEEQLNSWRDPVAVSPDGRWLVVRQGMGARLFDLEGKKHVADLDLKDKAHYPHWEGFAFSDDGKRVFGFGQAQKKNSNFMITLLGAAVCWTADGRHESELLKADTKSGQEAFAEQYGKEKLMTVKVTGPRRAVAIGPPVRDPWASPTHPWPLAMGNQVTVKTADGKKVLLDTALSLRGGGPAVSADGQRVAFPLADKGVVILDLPADQ